MKKYQSYINSINNGIKEFSKHLMPEFKISLIDDIKLTDPTVSWNLTEVGWDDTRFPNGESPGVYFIFGRKKDDENILGVYVGKASHNSIIGKRLYAHLYNVERQNKIYPMNDKNGNEFLLEFVLTIPMENIYFFAPSLEEFLIYYLQENNTYLINSVGKN